MAYLAALLNRGARRRPVTPDFSDWTRWMDGNHIPLPLPPKTDQKTLCSVRCLISRLLVTCYDIDRVPLSPVPRLGQQPGEDPVARLELGAPALGHGVELQALVEVFHQVLSEATPTDDRRRLRPLWDRRLSETRNCEEHLLMACYGWSKIAS